jgi:hypothetical protein
MARANDKWPLEENRSRGWCDSFMAMLQRNLSVEARDLRFGSWNKVVAGRLLRKGQGVGLTRALETRTFYVDGEQSIGSGDLAERHTATNANATTPAGRRASQFGIERLLFAVALAVIFFLLAQDMVHHRFFRGGRLNRNGSIGP